MKIQVNRTWLSRWYGQVKVSKFRLAAIIVPTLILLYVFYHVISCGQGVMGCGLYDFSVVFPFYLLVMPFVTGITFTLYIILYAISSAVYVAILYHFAGLAEKYYYKFSSRQKLTT